VGDIDFKVISDAENSNKFHKTRLEESVEAVITLGPTAYATPVPMMSEICLKVICNIHLNVFGPSL